MVLLLSKLNSFRVNRDKRLLFPTPESPISTTGEGGMEEWRNWEWRNWKRGRGKENKIELAEG